MKLGQIRINALHIVLVAGFVSSGCGMLGLGSMLGGASCTLTDQNGLALDGSSTGTTLGYEITTSGSNDIKADAGYLYGIYKPL